LFGDTPKAKRRQAKFNRTHPHKLRKHATLREARAALPDLEWPRFTVATIVRNPWDRMVSFYAWSRTQPFDHPMIAAAKEHTFTDYLLDPRVQRPLRHNSVEDYISGATNPVILRFETLATDVTMLATTLGIRVPPLERINTSDRPADYRTAYTDETAHIVASLFPYETQTLGYTFSF
jgi:hypothetical protein